MSVKENEECEENEVMQNQWEDNGTFVSQIGGSKKKNIRYKKSIRGKRKLKDICK